MASISKDVGLNYVGHDRDELNMIFHLDHMFLGHGPLGKFDPVPYTWDDINFYKEFSARGMSKKDFLKQVHQHGRDNVRTPMQWDGSPHAGFTIGTPWIGLNPNYSDINVEAALADPDSVFYFYKKMLAYRKQHLTLAYGDFTIIPQKSKDIFVYERRDGHQRYYILLNHSNRRQKFTLDLTGFHLEVSNFADGKDGLLSPWEGRIYRKSSTK
jgi:glycosidase